MSKVMHLATVLMCAIGLAGIGVACKVTKDTQGVSVTVKGESWDTDSRGFAYYGGLSKKEGEQTSARRGSRISVDGQPDKFAISGPGPGFELTFTTTEPSFRLIVEGDRFPRVLTQPYEVPKGGGELDIGRIDSPRAEGPEHTWPLVMTANSLGYASTLEMLADNKAAMMIYVTSSGAEGTPNLANDSTISIEGAGAKVLPFAMDTQITFFQMTGPRVGAFLVIVPFAEGEAPDKDVIIKVTDTVTETTWDPPRPWSYDPVTVSVRNGFSTPSIFF
ncbi:MAG: hypothetical protein IIA40_13075, partial [SAR324 cluster bacterium]|nr:hypothetical protein [SAR324 cluster bacterium]